MLPLKKHPNFQTMKPTDLSIKKINTSLVKPCRLALRDDVIAKYEQVLRNNDMTWVFPPLMVTSIDGITYLLDGQHRLEGAIKCVLKVVPISWVQCKDLQHAKRFALCANCQHGEKLTREEMRNNILAYLREGGAIESDTQIAKAFGVHRNLVADIRKGGDGITRKENKDAIISKVFDENPNASISEVSRKTGFDRKTVRDAIKDMTTNKPKGDILTDCFGHEIPQDKVSAYLAIKNSLKVATSCLNEFRDAVAAVNASNAFANTSDLELILGAIAQIRSILRSRTPDALCSCRGDGCRICGGVGFLEKSMFELKVPKENQ